MWLLNFLPNWIFHLVLITGIMSVIAAQVFRFIPFVSTYRIPLLVVGALLSVVGVFFEGATYNNDQWQLKVAEAEKRALEAEAKSSKANVEIVTKTAEKLKVIRDIQVVVQKEIVEKAAVIDADCRVPKEAIDILNKAAKQPEGLK